MPDWWKSCDDACGVTARQLDATGRADAAGIGAAIAARAIPFARVVTSEFCRAVETAELLDLGPGLEVRSDVTFFVYDETTRCANLLALLAEAPPAGSNTGVVSHAGLQSGQCALLNTLSMGEAAVFKPAPPGPPLFVGRLTPSQWASLPP